ncbi:hypothetical protein [Streptomyces niveus]|uniref:hypothetical protein n=1 Tax=Streptomyces niveus TaxID=193462 RepID=UPI0036BA327E
MSSTPEDRAARRAEVRRLTEDEGLSQRATAARLGISKETVKRDLAHSGAPQESGGARHEPPAHVPPVPHPGPGAPRAAQPARPGTLQEPGGARRSTRATLAAQTERAHAAMRQLADAVAEVVDARIPYTLVRDEVAHDWAAQLRQHAQQLVHERQQFADYYSGALVAGATVSRRPTTDAPPGPVVHQSPGTPAPTTPKTGR